MIREKQSDQEYCRLFRAARVFKPEDIPAADPRVLDVALLDMNHNWPNLGHDSFVAAVDSAVEELEPSLDSMGISVRMISYDVRKSLMVPEHPGDRFLLYLGTGGPGHLDPRLNDGASEGSQGIREDATWD